MAEALTISCDDCTRRASTHCADCVVTFLCGAGDEEGAGALVIDVAEARAVRMLADAGLVPRLRHRGRAAM